MSLDLHWDIDSDAQKQRPQTIPAKKSSKTSTRTRGSAVDAYRQAQIVRFPSRFRKLPILGIVLVSFFYVVDVWYPWPGFVVLTPRDFLAIRATWDLFYLMLLATSYWRADSVALQRLRDYTLVVGSAVFLGAVCAHTGRLASPYYAGLGLVAIARCTILPGFFLDTAASCSAMVIAFIVTACVWPAPLPISTGGAAGVLTVAILVSTLVLALVGSWLADRLALGLEAAKIMGRYRLVRRLGTGGMGEVFLAHHASLRRPCAVKILKQELCTPDAVARFEREAEAASRLRHPNTIAVFDFGRTDEGQPYYVMEYLEGCDLRELVSREGPLVPERAEHMLAQAASSLSEAHLLSMVHRDVQPGNLFVTATAGQGDFIKVLDFGLVKGVDLGPELTRAESFMGTPRYMAPEALTGRRVDARADVYSLGAIAYFCLCGAPPFASDDTYADMYQQIHETPPAIASRRDAGLPAPSSELVAVIMRCLEKDPNQRYASAGELLRAFEATPEHGRFHPPLVQQSASGHFRLPRATPQQTPILGSDTLRQKPAARSEKRAG